MKKLLGFIMIMFFTITSWGQCSVTATASSNSVVCGQCVDLNAIGIQGSFVMNNDFNGGTAGPGWTVTSAATFTNPCGPGPGGAHMWMGDLSPAPRTLTTTNFDMSCGGQVCFDFVMATQGGPSPCEGPDLTTEGVYFQYSTDGGVTWATINYFDPNGGFDPQMTAWNNYCFMLPAGAQTANTMFQWIQTATSSNVNDHWGIDNVQILANDCGYYYDWVHVAGSPNLAFGGNVCPTTTTTYDVIYTNGINDTCISTVTVNVLLPTVTATATPSVLGCGGCTTIEALLTNIPPDTCCFTLDMQDSFGDGWNGGFLTVSVVGVGNLGPFSATGNGSVGTFCVQGGTTFTLNYTSGSWETENTYQLLDPSGNILFNDGPSPTTGNVFTTTANCGNAPIIWAYQWNGQNISNPTDSITQACPTVSGLYTVEVYNTNNPLCSIMDGVNVTIPVGLDTTVYEDIINCGPINYTFPDGTTQQINSTTTYTSTLQTASGCDSLVVTTINILPTHNLVENFDVCPNTDFTFPDGNIQTITNNITYVSNLLTLGGCDSIITTNINVYTIPPFDISFSPNECPPTVMAITNNTPGTNCQWGISGPFSYETYNDCNIVTDLFEISGVYNVTLSMLSPDGCVMDTIMNNAFEIYPEPSANFVSQPINGNTLTNNTVSFTNNSIGGSSYTWAFGDGGGSTEYNPSHSYDEPGNYNITLYVENEYGCSDTAYGMVIMDPELTIYLPNTFTPDGDEFNNKFIPYIDGNDIYDFSMTIYNRWGEIVFITYDQYIGWDGTYGGKMAQDGTYVWKIIVSTHKGHPNIYIGHVNLLK